MVFLLTLTRRLESNYATKAISFARTPLYLIHQYAALSIPPSDLSVSCAYYDMLEKNLLGFLVLSMSWDFTASAQ